MDLTPYLPTIGVIVGALATIGGVAITARSGRKAEDKRLALEVEREAARIRREDEAQQREERARQEETEEARAHKQTEIYDSIAQHFVGELSNLRSQRTTRADLRGNVFHEWFKREWPINADTRLRRVIANLTNDEHRLRITQICDAVMDEENIATWEWEDGGDIVESYLTIGFDLASTYARGQELDADLEQRWTVFRKQVDDADGYRERQRLARIEALRKKVDENEATDAAIDASIDEVSPF